MRFILIILFVNLHLLGYAQVYVPIDTSSTVSFKIKNFGSTVDGTIKGLKGTINFDVSQPTDSKFDVLINTSTIDTGIDLRDKHLRNSEYFGSVDYPTIHFVSTKVVVSGKPNEAIVTGKLTIKKTTKEITFPFYYSEVGGVLQLKGGFQLNRRDFDVGGSSFSLADELNVILDVKASK
jgi:polyisoprenoid-binding protein YceI